MARRRTIQHPTRLRLSGSSRPAKLSPAFRTRMARGPSLSPSRRKAPRSGPAISSTPPRRCWSRWRREGSWDGSTVFTLRSYCPGSGDGSSAAFRSYCCSRRFQDCGCGGRSKAIYYVACAGVGHKAPMPISIIRLAFGLPRRWSFFHSRQRRWRSRYSSVRPFAKLPLFNKNGLALQLLRLPLLV